VCTFALYGHLDVFYLFLLVGMLICSLSQWLVPFSHQHSFIVVSLRLISRVLGSLGRSFFSTIDFSQRLTGLFASHDIDNWVPLLGGLVHL